MKFLRVFIALIMSGAVLVSCTTTQLIGEWRDKSYAGPPFRKIAVMVLSDDVTVRRVFEDVVAEQLAARGVTVKTSYGSIPTSKAMECEKVEKMVCDLGAEGVLVMRIAKQETVYDGTQIEQPNYFRGYLTSYTSAPTVMRYDVVTMDTRLYRVPSGALVWSGTSESIDQPTLQKEVRDYSKRIIKTLVARGLL